MYRDLFQADMGPYDFQGAGTWVVKMGPCDFQVCLVVLSRHPARGNGTPKAFCHHPAISRASAPSLTTVLAHCVHCVVTIGPCACVW
jgi:hypothetical protein